MYLCLWLPLRCTSSNKKILTQVSLSLICKLFVLTLFISESFLPLHDIKLHLTLLVHTISSDIVSRSHWHQKCKTSDIVHCFKVTLASKIQNWKIWCLNKSLTDSACCLEVSDLSFYPPSSIPNETISIQTQDNLYGSQFRVCSYFLSSQVKSKNGTFVADGGKNQKPPEKSGLYDIY